jgi:DinB family protein
MSIFTNSAARSVEEAQAYTTAILNLLGAREPISVLRETPQAVRTAIAGMPIPQLSQPEAPGKWSIRQVVRHLADSDLVWGYRLRMVLAHDRPTITGYDQDLWADRLRYNEAVIEEALDELAVLRRANLRLVAGASAADLDRVGVHSERGEESVKHMIRMYAGHDLLHLAQLARIRRAVSDVAAGGA